MLRHDRVLLLLAGKGRPWVGQTLQGQARVGLLLFTGHSSSRHLRSQSLPGDGTGTLVISLDPSVSISHGQHVLECSSMIHGGFQCCCLVSLRNNGPRDGTLCNREMNKLVQACQVSDQQQYVAGKVHLL